MCIADELGTGPDPADGPELLEEDPQAAKVSVATTASVSESSFKVAPLDWAWIVSLLAFGKRAARSAMIGPSTSRGGGGPVRLAYAEHVLLHWRFNYRNTIHMCHA